MMRHMQSRFLHELGDGDWHIRMQQNPDYLPFLMRVDAPAIYLSLWQATLYVVVEGWRKLALSDVMLDGLLQSSNVEALKLHRHGTFHYHEDITPPTYRALLQSPDVVQWTHALSDAFHTYFERRMQEPAFAKAAKNA
jgi:hypothetical protein